MRKKLKKIKISKYNARIAIRKNRKKQIINYIIIICTLIIIFISCLSIYFKITNLSNETKNIKKINDIVENDIQGNEEEFNEKDIELNEKNNNYNSVDINNINFEKLKNINNEINSFIKVDGTKISYPVVKHSDNNYYLTHSIDNSKNNLGWIFMDYRNNINVLSTNTVIYGHAVLSKNKPMFGSLYNTLNNSWLKKDSHKIYLKTETNLYTFNIFSVYTIAEESYYITTSFTSNISYQEYLNKMLSRSKYNFNQNVTVNDKIITLSTCYGKTERLVVQGVLVT